MINWLNCGNDYGEDLSRMIESEQAKTEFLDDVAITAKILLISYKLTSIALNKILNLEIYL
ncbi:MAG: hypothetical protein AAF630_15015 [Cyanobacteria bacterium P01_C01_bin.38]